MCRFVARAHHKPHRCLSASAIGYYGAQGAEICDEAQPPNQGFTHDLCRDWEGAIAPLREEGVTVSILRLGVVLDMQGGALRKMIWPFRLGLGGPIGDGRQYFSWISLHDLLRAIDFILAQDQPKDIYNLTAPDAVEQRHFAQELAHALRRPSLLPLPGFIVRIIFGEMGENLLLNGQRVYPKNLMAQGFQFEYPQLGQALKAILSGAVTKSHKTEKGKQNTAQNGDE